MKSIKELEELWDQLSDVPTEESEDFDYMCISDNFLHFEAGTDLYDVWHWFESQNNQFTVGKYLYPESITYTKAI